MNEKWSELCVYLGGVCVSVCFSPSLSVCVCVCVCVCLSVYVCLCAYVYPPACICDK